MTQSRREAALDLSEELLDDIELSRLPAPEIVKKTSRLARLLDDVEAMAWLKYEVEGYPGGGLDRDAAKAARRSNRQAEKENEDDPQTYWTDTESRLQANIDARTLQLQAAADPSVSITSANPAQHVSAPSGNVKERAVLSEFIARQHGIMAGVMGAIHSYVAERQLELRFGAAVETAFSVVRARVDAQIAELAPGAATKFAAAFENATSGNPEQWANAATACRRILKEIADELRPPGPDRTVGKKTIQMGDDNYINRIIDWIGAQGAIGQTSKDVVTTDLADFGKRLDAFNDAGHKGAHAEVTQYEASRFITGTYLLIGDILNLWQNVKTAEAKITGEGTLSVTGVAGAARAENDPRRRGDGVSVRRRPE